MLMRSDKATKVSLTRPRFVIGKGHPVLTVEVLRQHQLRVDKLSPRNLVAKPGWYPDALIPDVFTNVNIVASSLQSVVDHIDLPANETHGFWIDVFVWPGAPAEPVDIIPVVEAEGMEAQRLRVKFTIFDFALPDVPTMQTELGSPAARMEGYYKQRAKDGKEQAPTSWPEIYGQCAQLCADHRINAAPHIDLLWPTPQKDGSFRIRPDRVVELAKFIDKYHVNAVCVPNIANNACKDPVAENDKLRAWLKAYDVAAEQIKKQIGRDVTFYAYLIDEPNDAKAYEFTRKWGKAIRDAKSVVKVMVTEQPQPQDTKWGDLYGAVDIWCPLMALFEPGPAADRQKLGETIWAYTALTQGKQPSPWWLIDYPLFNYRVTSWIAWRYRVRGLLYWGGMAYWNEVADPWTDPWTYGHKESSKAAWNGEGVLVYPAGQVGFDGIVPSIRLKALRDGIQDYEYLAICERLGLADEADKIVAPLIDSWFKWNPDPFAYDAARAKLAALIVKARR